MNSIDLGKSFEKVIASTFLRQDGVLVERVAKGFKVLGKVVGSQKEVIQVINTAYENLSKSIK